MFRVLTTGSTGASGPGGSSGAGGAGAGASGGGAAGGSGPSGPSGPSEPYWLTNTDGVGKSPAEFLAKGTVFQVPGGQGGPSSRYLGSGVRI